MAICSIPPLAAPRDDTSIFIQALFHNCAGNVVVREQTQDESEARDTFLTASEALQYDPPTDHHVYIGMYGHRGKRTATTETCLDTGAVWADFDDTANSAEVLQRVRAVGLPDPSILIGSGRGIHAYWLLAERAGHEAVDVVKALSVALDSDPNVCKVAQVMRLPGSYNVKPHFLDNPPACHILSFSQQRHSLSLFQQALNVGMGGHDTPKAPIVALPTTEQPTARVAVVELLKSDMPCVRNAAGGVPKGHRNFWCGRITKDLQRRGYDKKQTFDALARWNKLCSPPEKLQVLRRSFEGYWRNDYSLLGCALDNPVLQSTLCDYCVGTECSRRAILGEVRLDDSVTYNNRVLKNLRECSGYDLVVYGLLQRHAEGLPTGKLMVKLTSPTGTMCMGESTLRSALKHLRELGFIETVPGNKRAGKEDFHKPIPQGTYGTGFTLVPNMAINGVIDGRITASEFRLYVLLRRYAFHAGKCFPSLRTLALELDCADQTVSGQLKHLEETDFIKRFYGYGGNPYKLTFKLL